MTWQVASGKCRQTKASAGVQLKNYREIKVIVVVAVGAVKP